MKTTNNDSVYHSPELIPLNYSGIEIYKILGIDQECNPEIEPWVYVDPDVNKLFLTPLDIGILKLETDLKNEVFLTLSEQQETIYGKGIGDTGMTSNETDSEKGLSVQKFHYFCFIKLSCYYGKGSNFK